VEIQIDEVTTRIQVQDSGALLAPEVLDRIIQAVLARLQEERKIEQQRREETTIRKQARRTLE
jgi:hypothetical protein